MNNELRATLLAVFGLGYCDEMAGGPVNEHDEIDMATAHEIEVAGLTCIGKMESFIGTNYAESPEQVHLQLYLAGRGAYHLAASIWMQRN